MSVTLCIPFPLDADPKTLTLKVDSAKIDLFSGDLLCASLLKDDMRARRKRRRGDPEPGCELDSSARAFAAAVTSGGVTATVARVERGIDESTARVEFRLSLGTVVVDEADADLSCTDFIHPARDLLNFVADSVGGAGIGGADVCMGVGAGAGAGAPRFANARAVLDACVPIPCDASLGDVDGIEALELSCVRNGETMHLKTYQREAVRWLASREDAVGARCPAPAASATNVIDALALLASASHFYALNCAPKKCSRVRGHPLWEPLPFCNPAGDLYWSRQTGFVVRASGPESAYDGCVGSGLLCEEPGLGKTIEVLALCLVRPFSRGPLLAPAVDLAGAVATARRADLDRGLAAVRDASGRGLILSSATIIIVTANILHQWVAEMGAWAPSLRNRLVVYEGMRSNMKHAHDIAYKMRRSRGDAGAGADAALDALNDCVARVTTQLALAEIVLVTYDVLQGEIEYDGARSVSTRTPSRYPTAPSPLFGISFHRAVLDEAQTIESSGSFARRARMAMNLHARHRWSVSGTPADEPEDVRALLAFLRHDPFGTSASWRVLSAAFGRTSDASTPIETPPRHFSASSAFDSKARALIARHGTGCDLLFTLLRPILWRSTVRLVTARGELMLPPVSHLAVMIKLAPTEDAVYREVSSRMRPVFLEGTDSPSVEEESDDAGAVSVGAEGQAPQEGKRARTEPPSSSTAAVADGTSSLLLRLKSALLDLRQASQHAEFSDSAQRRLGLSTRATPADGDAPRLYGRSVHDVYDRVVGLANNDVNAIKRKLYRAHVLLGSFAEGDAEAASGPAAKSALLEIARAHYASGWEISKGVVLWESTFTEEIGQLRAWSSLDIACLAGAERVARALGNDDEARAARKDAMENVVHPHLHNKLRWNKLYILTHLRRNSISPLQTALRHEWLQLPETATDSFIQLKREWNARTCGVLFATVSAPGDSFTPPADWPAAPRARALAAHERGKVPRGTQSILDSLAQPPSPLPPLATALDSAHGDLDEALWSRVEWAGPAMVHMGPVWRGARDYSAALTGGPCQCDDWTGASPPPGGFCAFDVGFMIRQEEKEVARRLAQSVKTTGRSGVAPPSSLLALSSGAAPRLSAGAGAGEEDAQESEEPLLPSKLLGLSTDDVYASAIDPGFQARVQSERKRMTELANALEILIALRTAESTLHPLQRLSDALLDKDIFLAWEGVVHDLTTRSLDDESTTSGSPSSSQSSSSDDSSRARALLERSIAPHLAQTMSLVKFHARRVSTLGVLRDSSAEISRGRFGRLSNWPLWRLHLLATDLQIAISLVMSMEEFDRMSKEILSRESELLDEWVSMWGSQSRLTAPSGVDCADVQASLEPLKEELRSAEAALRFKRQVRRLSRNSGGSAVDSDEDDDGGGGGEDGTAEGGGASAAKSERGHLHCFACFEHPASDEDTCVLPCGHLLCKSCFTETIVLARATNKSIKCGLCCQVWKESAVFRVDKSTMGKELSVLPVDTFLLRGATFAELDDGEDMFPRGGETALAAGAGAGHSAASGFGSPATSPRNSSRGGGHFLGAGFGVSPTDVVNAVEVTASFAKRYGSKVSAVVRRILTLPQEEKVIIASSWAPMLRQAAIACAELRVSARVLSGSAAARADVVRAFSTPSLRVLVMHTETDAAGLTLTAASHLFLLDQVLSADTVQQLAARISRQGQTRACFVYHCVAAPVDEVCMRFRECRDRVIADEADRVDIDKTTVSANELTDLVKRAARIL